LIAVFQRSYVPEFLLIVAAIIAFTDESVRKVLPNTPIYVTTVKQLLVLAAGALLLLQGVPGGRKFLLLFLPWTLYTFLSGLLVTFQYDSPAAMLAVTATYSAVPLLFMVGYYLGMQPAALSRLGKVFIIGSIAAALVAVLQEYGRALLPYFLQARIYKEGHAEAGGSYNESLFASPQILAQMMFPMLAWSTLALLVRRTSKMGFWAAVGVILCGYTCYLSRIRVSVALAAVMVLFILLLIRKTGLSVSRLAFRAIVAGFVLSMLAALLVAAVSNDDPSTLKGQRDEEFFSKLLDPTESVSRLFYWQNEIADLPDHNAMFGYGAGTGGSMRSVIDDPRLLSIRVISDTGIALLFHELGLLGLALFSLCYIGIPVWALVQIVRRRRVDPTAIGSLAVCFTYLVWFLIKSHPVIGNALSHIVWMTMLGISVGTLKRGEFEEQLQHQAEDGHFELPLEYDAPDKPLVGEEAAAPDAVFAHRAVAEHVYEDQF
jgi:hypothetical protein